MMQAYMDDSGTHDNSHNCVLAGYFGGVFEWRKFEIQWKNVLARYRVKEFHAKRFWAAVRGSPVSEYDGWKKRKLLEFLDRLLHVIESRKIYPFASGVLRSEWDKHGVQWRRVWTGATREHPSGAPSKPVFMAFVTNVIRITGYCRVGTVANIVVDEDRQMEGWANLCYAGLKSTEPSLARRLGELSFADGEIAVQLQASDLIAYEAHIWAREANGNDNYPMRRVYERCLANARSRDDFWMYDKQRFDNLRQLAKVLWP
ncbi:MAG TPA: DUF3800 domain-containing protein [Candidatus Acidoferrales bacterium]|nr:DUF3800 domain-containing protein [Candidatus Acidoferrales bacterium]